jgi:hypothetical protein
MLPFGVYYLHRKGAGPIPAGVILILSTLTISYYAYLPKTKHLNSIMNTYS